MREPRCGNCGHVESDHVRLPAHPDSAEECYGADIGEPDCDCPRFRVERPEAWRRDEGGEL